MESGFEHVGEDWDGEAEEEAFFSVNIARERGRGGRT